MNNRFLFDTDFRLPDAESIIDVSHDETKIKEQFDQIAYDKGFSDGITHERQRQSDLTETYLRDMLDALTILRQEGQERRRHIEDDIIKTALNLVHHFSSTLHPIDLLTSPQFGFVELFEKLKHEGEIVMTVSEDQLSIFENAFARLDSIHPPTIVSHPVMKKFDFEMNWKTGGIKFDQAALKAKIETTIGHYQTAGKNPQSSDEHDEMKILP